MVSKKYNFEEDTKALFEQLKFDRNHNTVDKSTLQALLLYCDVDRVDPFFFSCLNKKIEEHKGDQISLADFSRIFDFSKEPFPKMSVEELSQLFLIFDPNNKQEISYSDFIKLYQETPEFKSIMNESENVLKDFETLDPIRKTITPDEFLKILNVQNAQQK